MGALETLKGQTQRHIEDGPPEWNRQTKTQEEQGAQEAKAGGPWWPWPHPSARPLQPGPLYPPQKKSMGQLRGTRSPPGLNKHKTILKKTLVTVWSIYGHDRLAKP